MKIDFRKRFLTTAIVIAIATVGCGKKKSEAEDRDISPLAAGESLKLASESDAGTINLLETPAGTYKLVKIQTYRQNEANKTRALFRHDMVKLGDPENGDPFKVKVDWAQIDKSKEIARVTVELNLPYEIVASGTSVDFKNKHYYWHQVFSDDSWQWRTSGGESPNGVRFHEIFSAGTRSGKVFDAPNLTTSDAGKGIATLSGNDVTLFAEIKASHGDVVVLQITYRK